MFIELSLIAHAVLLSAYHNTPNLTTLIPILPASHALRASLCARFHAVVIKRCQSLESCRPSLRVRRHSKWQHLWKGGVRFLVTLLQRAFLTILPSGCLMPFEPSHSLACFSTYRDHGNGTNGKKKHATSSPSFFCQQSGVHDGIYSGTNLIRLFLSVLNDKTLFKLMNKAISII